MFQSKKVIYLILIFVLLLSFGSPVVVGEENGKVLYQKDVDEMLKEGNYTFSGCIFKGDIDLSGFTLTDADFSNAIFEKDVNFEDITFKTNGDNYTSFVDTHFKGEVHFEENIIFKGGVRFNNAVFEGDNNNFYDINATDYVHFNNVTFKKHVGFHKFRFEGGINFKGSIFESNAGFGCTDVMNIIKKSASFQNVTFGGNTTFMNVNFESAQFNSAEPEKDSLSKSTVFKGHANFEQRVTFGGADFNDVTFEGKVLFLDVTFERIASFKKGGLEKGTIFKGEVDFSGVKFESDVYFNEAIFEDNVWFSSGTTFGKKVDIGEKEVDFTGATFYDQISFSSSTFYIEANFYSAEFKGDTYFVGTTFEYNVNFRHAKFYNEANFNTAIFEACANFIYVSFKGETYFTGTIFENTIDFSKSKFEQRLDFNPSENSRVILTDTQTYEYAQITANLTETKFNNANLENVNFVNCIWPDNFIIYEEKKEKEKQKPNYKKLEILYKNLKNSFRKYGQSDLTGKAFYREMEMKRFGAKEEDNLGDYLFLLYFKLFAGYGEKPFNVIFCSLGIMGFFAFLFWILGIEISTIPYRLEFERYSRFTWRVDNRNRVRRLCKHRILNPICSFFSKIGLKRFFSFLWSLCSQIGIRDFAFCFLFSFSSFITLGTKYIKPKSNASHWLSVIESFIGTILIAAFVYLLLEKMFRYIK